ncbi:hypothetical protein GCM10022419_017640 [Nonomuraea rosea]|uniref:Uncharacterized protein n=1 Tax=Nonomuraea rosea TaxID=638574 RepID=A0ABP6VMU8_9ACTN
MAAGLVAAGVVAPGVATVAGMAASLFGAFVQETAGFWGPAHATDEFRRYAHAAIRFWRPAHTTTGLGGSVEPVPGLEKAPLPDSVRSRPRAVIRLGTSGLVTTCLKADRLMTADLRCRVPSSRVAPVTRPARLVHPGLPALVTTLVTPCDAPRRPIGTRCDVRCGALV